MLHIILLVIAFVMSLVITVVTTSVNNYSMNSFEYLTVVTFFTIGIWVIEEYLCEIKVIKSLLVKLNKLVKRMKYYLSLIIVIVTIVAMMVYLPIDLVNRIFMLGFVIFIIGMMIWFIVTISVDMYKTNKESKIREAKEALRRKLCSKYEPILGGLRYWYGDRMFCAEYHQYLQIFTVEYGNSEYCVKTEISTDGIILGKYTVPGRTLGFETPEDEIEYNRLVNKLISRIDEVNNK